MEPKWQLSPRMENKKNTLVYHDPYKKIREMVGRKEVSVTLIYSNFINKRKTAMADSFSHNILLFRIKN